MRFRSVRHWTVAALYLFVHLGIYGCSGSQEEGEDVEATDEEGSQEEGDEQATEEGNESTEEEGNGEEVAQGEEGNTVEGDGQGEEMAANGANQTETDLQEIINDQMNDTTVANGQAPVNGAAPTNAPPADQTAINATAPVNTTVANASATPVVGESLPEMGTKMPYFVQKGDTLGEIAMKIYGKQDAWKELQSLTGLSNPNRIYPGDVVYYQMTEQTRAFASSYEALPRSEVTVGPGDTLASIAKRTLGDASAWKFLWRYNDVDNPDQLTVGQVLLYVSPAVMQQSAAKSSTSKTNTASNHINGHNLSDNFVNFLNSTTTALSGFDMRAPMVFA